MFESTEISRVGLPIPHWPIKYVFLFLLNFKINLLNKSEIFNDEFYFKYSKNTDFLGYVFVLSRKNAVFSDFLFFLFRTQFPWFFCVFCIAENLPLVYQSYLVQSKTKCYGWKQAQHPLYSHWNTVYKTQGEVDDGHNHGEESPCCSSD